MSDNDVTLLKLVNESGDMADIGFYRTVDIGADSRLEYLEKQGFIKTHPPDDKCYAGDFEITGKGYAFLCDYESALRLTESAKRRTLLSNIYIPLIVSTIVSIIAAAITR